MTFLLAVRWKTVVKITLVMSLFLATLLDIAQSAPKDESDVKKAMIEAEKLWTNFAQTGDVKSQKDAIKFAEKAIELAPHAFVTHYLLSSFLHRSGEDNRALKHAKKASELSGAEFNVDVQRLLARTYIFVGNLPKAAVLLEELIAHDSSDQDSWHRLGTVQFELNQHRLAAKCFVVAGRLNRLAVEYLSAAHVNSQINNDECFSQFLQAIRLAPDDMVGYHELAHTLETRQRHKAAEGVMRMAIVRLPESAENWFRLGNTQMGQQRYVDSALSYRRASDIDAKHVSSLHNLAFSSLINGDKPTAVSAAVRAVKVTLEGGQADPMHVSALANACRRAGDLSLARAVAWTMRQPPEANPATDVINDFIGVDVPGLVQAVEMIEESKLVERARDNSTISPKATSNSKVSKSIVPHAIILYLVGPKPEHFADLKDSLTALKQYFLDTWPYDVLVFHEGLALERMHEVSAIYNRTAFYKLDFQLPSHVKAEDIPVIVAGHASVGYRHMCRFYSGGIFRLDVMQDYDWYWRVDTDSYILEPLATDPFATMSSNDLAYGYMALGREDEHLTTGLWDTTMEWANKQHVGKTALLDQFAPNGQWDRSYYYTNFELVNLKFFRSNQYLDYFDHLDRDTGGFYNHRWGDAPIRLLGVSMLAPKERVHHFNDIAYSHKVYVHVVCDRQKFSDCKKKRKSKKSKS